MVGSVDGRPESDGRDDAFREPARLEKRVAKRPARAVAAALERLDALELEMHETRLRYRREPFVIHEQAEVVDIDRQVRGSRRA